MFNNCAYQVNVLVLCVMFLSLDMAQVSPVSL